jgi:CBS domain-containing protein
MEVKQRMTHPVEIIGPDASIQVAAEKMRKLSVGILPVCEGNVVLGVLTDRDIVIRSAFLDEVPSLDKVSRIMTTNVYWCYEDQNIEAAARKMEEKQVRRLLVKNFDQDLVGILSISDLAIRGNLRMACHVFEKVSEPAHIF